MAYDMISDLTAVTTPATTDLVEIEQGGVSYKATIAQITGAPNGGQPPAGKAEVKLTPGIAAGGTVTFTMSPGAAYFVQAYTSTSTTSACIARSYFVTSGSAVLETILVPDTANLSISAVGLDITITNLTGGTVTLGYAVTRI